MVKKLLQFSCVLVVTSLMYEILLRSFFKKSQSFKYLKYLHLKPIPGERIINKSFEKLKKFHYFSVETKKGIPVFISEFNSWLKPYFRTVYYQSLTLIKNAILWAENLHDVINKNIHN